MKHTTTVAELLQQLGHRQVVVDTRVVERFRAALDSYPPIDSDVMADGRTKLGRQERRFNDLNGLALAMLNQIEDLVGANHTLALGMNEYADGESTAKAEAAELKEKLAKALDDVLPMQRHFEATPVIMMMITQLVLLTQFRPHGFLFYPQHVTKDGDKPAIVFSLGGIVTQFHVNPFVAAREIQLIAGSSAPHTVKVDRHGNISVKQMEALVGYLFMAGFNIDRANVELALSPRFAQSENKTRKGKKSKKR